MQLREGVKGAHSCLQQESVVSSAGASVPRVFQSKTFIVGTGVRKTEAGASGAPASNPVVNATLALTHAASMIEARLRRDKRCLAGSCDLRGSSAHLTSITTYPSASCYQVDQSCSAS